MEQPTICPYCGESISPDQQLCMCGAYRVDDDNYHLSFRERFGSKLTKKNVNEILGGG